MAIAKAAKKARAQKSTRQHNESLNALATKIEQLTLSSQEREDGPSDTNQE